MEPCNPAKEVESEVGTLGMMRQLKSKLEEFLVLRF